MNEKVTDIVFKKFSKLVYEKSGINLTDKKKALFQSRVKKIMRSKGIEKYSDYYKFLAGDETGRELIIFIDRISTNVTSFFRGNAHFVFVRDHWVDEWREMNKNIPPGKREINIWSAGCSKGAESYSLGIVLLENLDPSEYRSIKIFSSDISKDSLAYATKAVYTTKEVKDVPSYLLHKYFYKGKNKSSGFVKVKENLRSIVEFQYFNLMDNFSPIHKTFDLIFCRNTMIYFDKPTKQKLVNKYYKKLKNYGYFFTGHSESLGIIKHDFFQIQPSLYQKRLKS
ncbi:MAG: protein-glutamate O-methyltransferase CheR [Candidatus Cloacimonadota bacterium]|nr:protein-glutamate O-methyltransferase CheR [Candidatus Cloacimonadota bacterium]